jgi:hypothetical protein
MGGPGEQKNILESLRDRFYRNLNSNFEQHTAKLERMKPSVSKGFGPSAVRRRIQTPRCGDESDAV